IGPAPDHERVPTQGTLDPITLAALADFPNRLEAYYSAVPRERRNWRPSSWDGVPSEPFTPIEQVCHVRDIEIDGYHVRFQRTLEESNPLLASLDGELLARERSYATADTAAAVAEFRDARGKTIALISHLTPHQLARAAEFEGHSVTLRGLVHNLCSHDQQHLAGLQWLLARMAAP
ncbi:MAG TPA: DinB family protein, partial [Steroidobacteraceae bacterium]|nr:DinB family protein [Steroidobacteraceae bacterium]